jgi:hypothetical protein
VLPTARCVRPCQHQHVEASNNLSNVFITHGSGLAWLNHGMVQFGLLGLSCAGRAALWNWSGPRTSPPAFCMAASVHPVPFPRGSLCPSACPRSRDVQRLPLPSTRPVPLPCPPPALVVALPFPATRSAGSASPARRGFSGRAPTRTRAAGPTQPGRLGQADSDALVTITQHPAVARDHHAAPCCGS